METTTENINQVFLSDFAVLLKKMRLLRKLTRQQAGLLFDFSFKNIERLENGRGATLKTVMSYQNLEFSLTGSLNIFHFNNLSFKTSLYASTNHKTSNVLLSSKNYHETYSKLQ